MNVIHGNAGALGTSAIFVSRPDLPAHIIDKGFQDPRQYKGQPGETSEVQVARSRGRMAIRSCYRSVVKAVMSHSGYPRRAVDTALPEFLRCCIVSLNGCVMRSSGVCTYPTHTCCAQGLIENEEVVAFIRVRHGSVRGPLTLHL